MPDLKDGDIVKWQQRHDERMSIGIVSGNYIQWMFSNYKNEDFMTNSKEWAMRALDVNLLTKLEAENV